MYVKRRFHQIAIEDENLIKSKAETMGLLQRITIKNTDSQLFTIQQLRETQNYQGISKEFLQKMQKSLNFQEEIAELENLAD